MKYFTISILLVSTILIFSISCDNLSSAGNEALVRNREADDNVTDKNDVKTLTVEEQYYIAEIGDQIWMSSNLDEDKFRNGDPIPEATTDEEWSNAGKNKQPVWCYYDFDPANGKLYGRLYNWYAVADPRGLAPQGWHVPSDQEWDILISNLGGAELAMHAMKYYDGWNDLPNGDSANGDNSSGFAGLPAGFYGSFGFGDMYNTGIWWSSTEDDSNTSNAWFRSLFYQYNSVDRESFDKKFGLYVRCVKD